ncbi:MAG: phage holin family protein [Candidatus Absconditicoccaceae bacterium]
MIKNLIINVVINGVILYFIHKYDLGFKVQATRYDVYMTFLILGFVFWFFNFILKRILKILTLPLKILTFGISSLIINVLVIYIFEYVVNTYGVEFGIVVSLGTVLQVLVLSFIITLSYLLIKKII